MSHSFQHTVFPLYTLYAPRKVLLFFNGEGRKRSLGLIRQGHSADLQGRSCDSSTLEARGILPALYSYRATQTEPQLFPSRLGRLEDQRPRQTVLAGEQTNDSRLRFGGSVSPVSAHNQP